MAAEEVDYQQPGQKKTCAQRLNEISETIWNAEKHEFLGRTASSWGTFISKDVFANLSLMLFGVPLRMAKGKIEKQALLILYNTSYCHCR